MTNCKKIGCTRSAEFEIRVSFPMRSEQESVPVRISMFECEEHTKGITEDAIMKMIPDLARDMAVVGAKVDPKEVKIDYIRLPRIEDN